MALGDNVVFAHFFDSLTADYPSSGFTASNPGSTGDPTVASSAATFDVTAPSDGLLFTTDSGNWITAGTADFTVAVRCRIDTNVSNGNYMLQLGTATGRNITFRQASSVGFTLSMYSVSGGYECRTTSSQFTVGGSHFTLVARRDTGVTSIWVDGSDVTDSGNNSFGSLDLNSTYSTLSLGSSVAGATAFGGNMEFAVVWDRALTDSEIANNVNETDLKAAILGGSIDGSGTPAAQDATASGTAERELPSSGTPAAQASSVAGTAERVLLCSGELLSGASSVSGTAALQVKLLLTAAVNRELRDENGSPVANLAGIIFEWYDKDTDTDGTPDVSGTFSTNASGEATVQLAGSSLVSGQYGLLVLEHPSDNTIRGIYRIPVS